MDYQEDQKKLNIDDIDHLNLDSSEMSWDTAPQHDHRAMGNSAIISSEPSQPMPNRSEELMGDAQNSAPNIPNSEAVTSTHVHRSETPPLAATQSDPILGQVVPTMPPGYIAPGPAPSEMPQDRNLSSTFARHNAMVGDRLSDKAINACQDMEQELSDSGDVVRYVEEFEAARAAFQGKETAA